MMADVARHATTIALIYAHEEFVRRNRIREKLEARGLRVKKEYQSDSKAFDFMSVNLVVIISDNAGNSSRHTIEQAALRANVPIVAVQHRSSGWQALDPYCLPPEEGSSTRLHLVPTGETKPDDEDVAALASMYAEEATDLRLQVQRLTGDAGNMRADRERLEKEVATLKGQVIKLETTGESARLGAGEVAVAEVRKHLEASRRALEEKKQEHAAALDANRILVRERDAAREAIARDEKHAETIHQLHVKAEGLEEQLRKERDASKMAVAREGGAYQRERKTKLELDAAMARVARAESEVAKLKAAPPVVAVVEAAAPKKDIASIAKSLSSLVDAGVLSEREAFDKLMAAAQ